MAFVDVCYLGDAASLYGGGLGYATPESAGMDLRACFDAEERSELENEIPAGRFAAPSEVADFVQQLIDAPSYLTGQIISFDGGYL